MIKLEAFKSRPPLAVKIEERERKILYQDRFFWVSFLINLLLNLALWLFIWRQVKPTAAPIFLHYNIYFGVDLVGSWYRLYYYSAGALLALAVNYFLGGLIYQREKVLSYFLFGATILIQLFFALTIVFIIYYNR